MNLLYPYRNDENNGYALRYSIRSMCKHGDITGCLIIGDCPSWYTGKFIPAIDGPRKEWNIVSKVMMAPPGEWLYAHDDIFALLPFNRPMYHSGMLSKTHREGLYADRIRACITIYPYGMMYDNHMPMVIDSDTYRKAHSRCDWANKEYLSKTIYGNFIGGGEYITDFKYRTRIDVCPDGRPFFSANDQMITKLNLQQLYPNPSPYEADV